MIDGVMWDDPETVTDDDELKPTLKVIPRPMQSFEERLADDQRRIALQFNYGQVAA